MEKLIHNKDSVICYKVDGPEFGLPVVFIHGFPLSMETWNDQVEFLKDDYKVIRYDISGHDKSVSADSNFTIDGHAEDLIKVLDECKISKAIIVGLSMGGYIALRAIEKYNDRFIGLVLCNTKAKADDNKAKIKRAEQVASLRKDGIQPYAEATSKALLSKSFQTNFSSSVKNLNEVVLKHQAKNIAGNLIALAARTDTTDYLEKIDLPVLIIYSEEDTIITKEEVSEMNRKIKNSDLKILPGAGHLSNIENPEAFNNALRDFLKLMS